MASCSSGSTGAIAPDDGDALDRTEQERTSLGGYPLSLRRDGTDDTSLTFRMDVTTGWSPADRYPLVGGRPAIHNVAIS